MTYSKKPRGAKTPISFSGAMADSVTTADFVADCETKAEEVAAMTAVSSKRIILLLYDGMMGMNQDGLIRLSKCCVSTFLRFRRSWWRRKFNPKTIREN
jgi:hypothetical protein